MKLSRILLSILMFAILLSGQNTKRDAPATPPAKKSATAVNPADQCQAKTKAGDQCKRKASAGSKFCWQHGAKSSNKAAPKKS